MATKSKPLITIVFLATLITIATSQSSNPFLNMPPPASVSNLPPPLPAGSGSGSGGSYNPYAPPALTYPSPLGILPNSPPLPFVYYPAPPPPDPILPYFPWYYKHAPPKPSTSSANRTAMLGRDRKEATGSALAHVACRAAFQANKNPASTSCTRRFSDRPSASDRHRNLSPVFSASS
ncbi:hypothetical protein ACLOJK_032368 [Asimina triloba]